MASGRGFTNDDDRTEASPLNPVFLAHFVHSVLQLSTAPNGGGADTRRQQYDRHPNFVPTANASGASLVEENKNRSCTRVRSCIGRIGKRTKFQPPRDRVAQVTASKTWSQLTIQSPQGQLPFTYNKKGSTRPSTGSNERHQPMNHGVF